MCFASVCSAGVRLAGLRLDAGEKAKQAGKGMGNFVQVVHVAKELSQQF